MRIPNIFNFIIARLFDVIKRSRLNAFYAKSSDPWARSQHVGEVEDAVSMVGDRRYARALDIGGGEGYFSELLAPQVEQCEIIDISDVVVERARARLKSISNISVIQANVRTFSPTHRYDLIILGDVLYYLGDALLPKAFDALLARIASWVLPGGRILLTHYLQQIRDEQWLGDRYLAVFTRNGFVSSVKKYREGRHEWLHVVLDRVADTR